MPNIKSAKKRVIVNQKKTELNKAVRSEVKTAIKKVEEFVIANKPEEAKTALNEAFAIIDRAASNNVIHKNNAANKKAKLSKKVSALKPVEKKATKKVKTEEVKAEPVEEKATEEVKTEPVKKPRARKTTKKADAE